MSTDEKNLIITPEIFQKIYKLNFDYQNVFKVLLATFESLEEKFPFAIYNESRAFIDHIGRCYIHNTDKEYIEEQLNRAERHLNRMIMDCYKELFVIYVKRIEEFKKYSRNLDFAAISGGEFYPKYNKYLREAEERKREAKKCVSYEEDYKVFQNAVVAYADLDDYIRVHLPEIQRLKSKRGFKNVLGFLGWLAATVISALLANNNQYIIDCFKKCILK